MARTSWIARQSKDVKFATRRVNRCHLCGRRRGYMRAFGICRICFRENALHGNIPGVGKASW
ncbi:MAG: type Z 30S ribosomal protein S14 [candidate division WS1 bacterium]|nr:type Z 30S ribosomal protein S14 [candidate division WS1 bacterium]